MPFTGHGGGRLHEFRVEGRRAEFLRRAVEDKLHPVRIAVFGIVPAQHEGIPDSIFDMAEEFRTPGRIAAHAGINPAFTEVMELDVQLIVNHADAGQADILCQGNVQGIVVIQDLSVFAGAVKPVCR